MTTITLGSGANTVSYTNADTFLNDNFVVNAGLGDDAITSTSTITNTTTINGQGGDDTITIGGSTYGAFYAYGGTEDDTYVISGSGDIFIVEALNEGIDTVRTAFNGIQLPEFVENIVYLGDSTIYRSNIRGNYHDNHMTGSIYDDSFYGNDGADTMVGGNGDDFYFINSADDIVIEMLNGGNFDKVLVAQSSYTLPDHVERLKGWSGPAIDQTLIGNDLDNEVESNTATSADILDGGIGEDRMIGYSGNDTYFVDNVGDTIVESASQGTADMIKSYNRNIDLANFANVENVDVIGSLSLSIKGSAAANILLGNSGANAILGSGGADTIKSGNGADKITGGSGRDMMWGGSGADDFDFNFISHTGITSATRDIIKDFTHLSDDIDVTTIDANSSTTADDDFTWLGAVSANTGAGQLRYEQDSINVITLIFGYINNDAIADFTIELTGLKTLTMSDFIL